MLGGQAAWENVDTTDGRILLNQITCSLTSGPPSQLSVIDSWLRGLGASFSNRSIIVLFILQRHAQSVSTKRHTLCRCRQDQQTNP